jgi:uncharacterized protein (DUF1800 family)
MLKYGTYLLVAGLAAGLPLAGRGAPAVHAATAAAGPPRAELSRQDILWLERVTYGPTSQLLARYQEIGRQRFLEEQLHPQESLPPAIDAQIAALEISRADAGDALIQNATEQRRINSLSDDTAKQDARRQLNDRGNRRAYEAARRELLHALYSPAQLKEQMVWFWLNHFSVFKGKADGRWLVGDYAQTAIRPHALGSFRDLVMATLTHPAMIQYLDNVQNAAGHLNENYARELMELHTLGVEGGYTQADVEALARILTGVGLNTTGTPPRLEPRLGELYLHQGAFEYNPARHDFSDKRLLGTPIAGSGFHEVEQAVDLLVSQPACARFIARKLAVYFIADDPPSALVDRLAQAFQQHHGDIPAVLRVLLESREFSDSLGTKLKDPVHYVISAVRLAYDGKPIANTHPVLNWLNALGEPPFGRQTPDGYPLTEGAWASSGQLSRRFEIARAIGGGNSGLFEPEDGSVGTVTGFPQLSSKLYFETIEPFLSVNARAALANASSQGEWNTFLLSSPDLNYH